VAARRPSLLAYEQALALALERRFADALALLRTLPPDGPSEVLARRCRTWLDTPPPPDWDGTWTATSK
jgi:adenylate cyclase